MKPITKLSFLVLVMSSILMFSTAPADARRTLPCEQHGDLELYYVYDECYPDNPLFCFNEDSYCDWYAETYFSCESEYGICWDNDSPCEYHCCCRIT